jgi:hypothetical protein
MRGGRSYRSDLTSPLVLGDKVSEPHGLSITTLQRFSRALRSIDEAGRAALGELRALLGLLRSDGAEVERAPSRGWTSSRRWSRARRGALNRLIPHRLPNETGPDFALVLEQQALGRALPGGDGAGRHGDRLPPHRRAAAQVSIGVTAHLVREPVRGASLAWRSRFRRQGRRALRGRGSRASDVCGLRASSRFRG